MEMDQINVTGPLYTNRVHAGVAERWAYQLAKVVEVLECVWDRIVRK